MKIRGRKFPRWKFGLQQNYIANSRNKRLARSARVCLDSPKSHDSLLSYVASLSKPRYVYNVYIRVIYVCILSLERFELIGARRIPPEPVCLPRKNHRFQQFLTRLVPESICFLFRQLKKLLIFGKKNCNIQVDYGFS